MCDISIAPYIGDFDWLHDKDTQGDEEKHRKTVNAMRRKWQAEVGFKNIVVITIVMMPFRLQALYASPFSLGSVLVLTWYSSLLCYFAKSYFKYRVPGGQALAVIAGGIAGRDFGDTDDTDLLIGLQLLWAGCGQFWYLTLEEMTYITPSSLMLMCLHVPRWLFVWILLPANAAACYGYHVKIGSDPYAAAGRCGLQAIAIMVMYFTRDRAEKNSYCSRLENERDRIEGLRKRLWAEAQRSSFQGMLDSVFDASCMCKATGEIVTSTPHMDMILMEPGARKGSESGLSGMNLSSLTNTESEKARVEQFLASVSQGSGAQKIQLSLQKQTPGNRANGATVEVTASGIAMDTQQGKESSGRQVFIGLQLSLGMVPEAEDLDVQTPQAPNLDEVLNHPPLPRKDESLDTIEVDDAVDGKVKAAGRARSLISAPPIMECQGFALSVAGDACDDGDGDCLPGSTVVRIEGKAGPCRLDTVEKGQKVLCYDHLSNGLKYVDIIDVEAQQVDAPDLVEVTLEDGTELQMTSDHPVFVDDDDAKAKARAEHAIRASELKPGHHRVAVQKVVQVLVKSVEKVTDAEATTIMSVSVHQPQRHSLFVSPSAENASQSMAVASASMTDPEAMVPLEYRLKNTFIELPEDPSPTRRLRRTSSAPAAQMDAIVEGMSPSLLAAHTAAGTETAARRVPVPSSRASTISQGTYASSVASRASRASEAAAIILSKGVEDRRVRGWTIDGSACLTDVIRTKAQGLKSFGSVGHEDGWCYPCLMENWHNSDRPCRFGIGCSRCHEPHNRRQFKKARYQKPRLIGGVKLGNALPAPAPAGRVN